jgi:tetratricopeptide (TPR) repeat protein
MTRRNESLVRLPGGRPRHWVAPRHFGLAGALLLCVLLGLTPSPAQPAQPAPGHARAVETPEHATPPRHQWMAPLFVRAGQFAAAFGRRELAVGLYTQAISLYGEDNPHAVVAFVYRADLLDRLGRHEDARKDKEWIMRGMPGRTTRAEARSPAAAPSDPLSQTVADAVRAAGVRDFDRAIELYSLALADESLSGERRRKALKGRAFSYEQIKRFSEAEEDLTALARLAPNDPLLHVRRGHFYLDRNRLDEAYAVFEAGARLKPSDSGFRYGMGRVHSARKEFAAAIAQYNEAIRLTSGSSLYYLWRAEAHLQLEMYREALADYDKALATGWLTPRAKDQLHFGRGFLFLSTGQFESALHDLDKALAAAPDHANGRRWRGLAHEQLGHRERALEDYEHALKLMPDDTWLKERVSRLRAS